MSLIHTYASHLNFVSRPLILYLRNMPAVYVQVTGEANENHVCEALRHYRDRAFHMTGPRPSLQSNHRHRQTRTRHVTGIVFWVVRWHFTHSN